MQVIFRKRVTNYRAVLREMTYEDKASCDSTPPCIECEMHFFRMCVSSKVCAALQSHKIKIRIYTKMNTDIHAYTHTHTHNTHTHAHTHTHTHTPGTWRQRIWMFQNRETSGCWSNFSKVSSTVIIYITFHSKLTFENFYPVHSAVPC